MSIEKLESINRKSSTPKQFAKACFDLANKYQKNGKNQKAKDNYLKIKEEDDEFIFSHANYQLGLLFSKEFKFDDAMIYFNKVNKRFKEIYSESKYILGFIYYELKKEFDEAAACLKEVDKVKGKEFYYYHSQYILGKLFRVYFKNKEQSKKYF